MRTQLPPVGEIKRFFPNHRVCVVKVFLLLVQCILGCRTVCLYKCRAEVGSILGQKQSNINTAYTRLIRFFKIKKIDLFCAGIIRLIIHLIDSERKIHMVLDRTNWKIGGKNINVLFIGLLLNNGAFIPIIWQLYNKRGNTSEEERCELIKRFFKIWPPEKKVEITLLGDREFIGVKWFKFMKENCFSFIMRARMQDYWGEVAKSLGKKSVEEAEKHIFRTVRRKGYFQTAIKLDETLFYYTVFPNNSNRKAKDDEWLILISDKNDMEWISTTFPKRWGIEVFFYHSKTNGFNLEDLNLVDLAKAQLMMGVVALCYILSIKKGIEFQRTTKTLFKKYKEKKSKAISLFRLGYDNLKSEVHTVKDLIYFILCGLPDVPIWKARLWKEGLKSVQ
jgi:Transposase DDE domain